MARAIALNETGSVDEAYSHFAQATHVRFDLVNQLVHSLKDINVEAVVAPYEADAQLAHLRSIGEVDFIVSEDSDLLAYGCDKVLFKLDMSTGFGVEVGARIDCADEFQNLSFEGCQLACILAGCDYGPFVQGVGIRKAIEVARECDRYMKIPNLLAHRLTEILRLRGVVIGDTTNLQNRVSIARAVFAHQTIFDTRTSVLGNLNGFNPTEIDANLIHFLGHVYDHEVAQGVYQGLIHPVTLVPFSRARTTGILNLGGAQNRIIESMSP